MKFSVYNVATGIIDRIIDCDEDQAALQAGDGEAVWLEALDDTQWQIVGGAKVPYARTKSRDELIDDILRERRRRLSMGFDHDFGDARGVHRIGTTEADMAGWDEVSKFASGLIGDGTPDVGIAVVTDSGPAVVTAAEWQAVLVAAGAFRQPIWAASFLLQSMDPIPQDVADDGYWPTVAA